VSSLLERSPPLFTTCLRLLCWQHLGVSCCWPRPWNRWFWQSASAAWGTRVMKREQRISLGLPQQKGSPVHVSREGHSCRQRWRMPCWAQRACCQRVSFAREGALSPASCFLSGRVTGAGCRAAAAATDIARLWSTGLKEWK